MTPTADGDNTINPEKGPISFYWCTFTDESESTIGSLCAQQMQKPDRAVLLPETDLRVQYLLNPPESKCIQRLSIESFEDLLILANLFDNGIPKPVYRGQGEYDWHLETVLERNTPSFVLKETGLEVYEYRVLTESQRRLQHFLPQRPDDNDLLSWLALLRHHGVPTRLLDVTRSIFIACFFALKGAKSGCDAAIWIFSRHALNGAFIKWENGANDSWLRSSPFTVAQYGEPYHSPTPKPNSNNLTQPTIDTIKHPEIPHSLDYYATLDAALRGYIERPGIAVAEPFWLSKRIDVQQGTFLIPFNIRESFESNLFSFMDITPHGDEERIVPKDEGALKRLWAFSKIIKVRIPPNLHDILRVKLETMNIRDLTIFPDIEGAFAHISSFVPRE